jgi:hypothetical protein
MFSSKKVTTPEQRRLRELLQRIAAEEQFDGIAGLAEKMTPRMTPQGIYKWVYAGRVPIEKAQQIERLTNGKYTRQEISPWAYL